MERLNWILLNKILFLQGSEEQYYLQQGPWLEGRVKASTLNATKGGWGEGRGKVLKAIFSCINVTV